VQPVHSCADSQITGGRFGAAVTVHEIQQKVNELVL
jgi:hypothetical protein